MKELVHNGVLIPERYQPKGFQITVKGNKVKLNALQEEMAYAWAKLNGTTYAEDKIFARNFFRDFQKALGIGKISVNDIDFSDIIKYVESERATKANLTQEQKRELAAKRKIVREANREKYGYAMVDGARVEVANYTVEPPSIFIGRGNHPLRGRWKPRIEDRDISLNLSPSAPRPEGKWKEVVWEPNCMWIAKWRDKLRGKVKHVWLSDTFSLKQEREIEKFNKAVMLETKLDALRNHINAGLLSKDPYRRKVATVSYLIDALKLRVGDEKDEDEADTVGAITLRPEHIIFGRDGLTTFDFLGKDSVRWKKSVVLPQPVIDNLKEFIAENGFSIFSGLRSKDVTSFLSEVVPGLTAKVFRTYHASKVVRDFLEEASVSTSDPEFIKKHIATMANLQAAIICNHKRKTPKRWTESLAKEKERLKKVRSMKITPSRRRWIKARRLKIGLMKATKEYNLRTSLKSYIDPRIYRDWSRAVGYDWKLYYPKALSRKFSWVDGNSVS